ncbi:MAG: dihydrodipicolinate synthase family protein [Actinobacteria bacterium]|nr:dihydrodipicolinate synthase family protein [Actinomycetota bacterium]
MLKGVLAAAVTPLRDGGAELDDDAFGAYADFLVAGGLDGILVLGTTGEGILLSLEERTRVARLFLDAIGDRIQVAVHCGAQTTADTVRLAQDSAEAGAAAVAVIGPPYYAFDEESLVRHFVAAAAACAPLPFYLYEFRARTGYSLPVSAIERIRDEAPNLSGLKVSNSPFEYVQPFLIEGLDVFVGSEPLILRGLESGATGAVSGLAAVFPEAVVRLVKERSGDVGELRAGLERFPFQAATKHALGARGVSVRGDVRAPLRPLSVEERAELDAWLESL